MTIRAQGFFTVVLVGALAVTGCVKRAPVQTQDDNKPKPATEATKQVNAALLQRLDFADKQDFEDAKAGFIEALPDGGVVKNDKQESLNDLLGCLEPFEFWFNIVTANPDKG